MDCFVAVWKRWYATLFACFRSSLVAAHVTDSNLHGLQLDPLVIISTTGIIVMVNPATNK